MPVTWPPELMEDFPEPDTGPDEEHTPWDDLSWFPDHEAEQQAKAAIYGDKW